VHLARSKDWRARHPGYWRKAPRRRFALKDVSTTQPPDSVSKTGTFVRSPLQDLLTAQPAVLIGLIAHLVGMDHLLRRRMGGVVLVGWLHCRAPLVAAKHDADLDD
jgi:hypothetical protein